MLQSIIFETVYLAMIFFLGLGLARLLVPFSRRIAVMLGVVDRPGERRVHDRVVPRMGGLAMALALLITLLVCVRFDNSAVLAVILGAGIVVFTGLMDDTVGLSPQMKFVGEVLAATAFVVLARVSLVSFGDLLGFGEIRTGWLGPVITIFCMVGVMNALNLSDGLDGLAGGISFIAALMLAALAYQNQAWYWSVLALSLLGVLLGFLRHNQHPATLFMGDTGSLLLGFSLAAIAVGLARPGGDYTPVPPVTLGILLALPIIDTLWVMGRRLVHRTNPFRPDKTHLHHRLMDLGIGHAGVVVVYYVLMLGCALLAWHGRHWPEWRQFYTVVGVFAGLYVVLYLLERSRVDVGPWVEGLRRFGGRQGALRGAWPGPVQRGLVVLVTLLLAAPLAGLLPVPRVVGLVAFMAALLVFLLFPWSGKEHRVPLGHGVLYLASVMLLIVYMFTPDRPGWVMPLLYGTAGICLAWVLMRLATSSWSPPPWLSAFEILMLFFSWSFPLVILPMLKAPGDLRLGVALACLLALPLLGFAKVTMIDRRKPNVPVAVGFMVVFLVIGGTAFI